MTDKQTSVRKRQKIQDSNRVMFIWIAGASVIVGFAVVLSWFLWQQTAFRMKVASAKENTASILKRNNEAVSGLSDAIRLLNTNKNLLASVSNADDNAVQVVLDALPADPNSLALGASLQHELIGKIDGVRIESLSAEPLAIGEAADTSGATASSGNQISFSFEVTADTADPLKNLLARFEKSIRVIDIDTLEVERTEDEYTLTVNGHGYYEPEKTITLEDKSVE